MWPRLAGVDQRTRHDMQLARVDQSPTNPAFVQDPYPFYRRLRALGDFVFWTDYAVPMATTHVAATSVMRHPRLGRRVPHERRSVVPDGLAPFYNIERHSLLEIEPPDHTRIRRLAMRAFGRDRLAPVAPDISRIADALVDAFPAGPFDLIDAFARRLPAIAITRFIGIPQDMADQLRVWSNAMVAMYQARRGGAIEAAAAGAAADFAAFLRDYLATRRRVLRNDFLSDLIAGEAGGEITTDELVSTVVLLLNAGHEATVHAIGNAVRWLAAFPERALALDPVNVADTVEECLRFDPPLHMFRRQVYDAVTIMDHRFEAGDEIGCLLGSACRDDAVWPDGEVFDPFRARRANLGFGTGIHACIGASLARLELQIALPALFSRCPGLRIAEPPVVANLYHFHGLERLMVDR